MAKLLAVADPEIIPYFALGAFAGIRSEERRKMDWSMIDLNKKRITIPLNVATIGEEGRIPIYDNLLERLTPKF